MLKFRDQYFVTIIKCLDIITLKQLEIVTRFYENNTKIFIKFSLSLSVFIPSYKCVFWSIETFKLNRFHFYLILLIPFLYICIDSFHFLFYNSRLINYSLFLVVLKIVRLHSYRTIFFDCNARQAIISLLTSERHSKIESTHLILTKRRPQNQIQWKFF